MNTAQISVCGPLSLSLLSSAGVYNAVLVANEIPLRRDDVAAVKRALPALENRLFLEGADTKNLRRHSAGLDGLDFDDDRQFPLLWEIGFELQKISTDLYRRAANAAMLAGSARFRSSPGLKPSDLLFLRDHYENEIREPTTEILFRESIRETEEEPDLALVAFRDQRILFYPEHFGQEGMIDPGVPKVLALRRSIVREMRQEIGANWYDAEEPDNLSETFLAKAAAFPDLFIEAVRDFLPPYSRLDHVSFLARYFLERHHYFKAAYFCRSVWENIRNEIPPDDYAMAAFWPVYAKALHRLGFYGEAQRAYHRALKILSSERVADKDLMRLYADLSDLHRAEGRYPEARYWMMQAIDLHYCLVKTEDLYLSIYLYKLAVIHEGLGETEKAHALYRRSLAIRGEVLANSFLVSASVYAKKGEAASVLEMAKQAEKIRTAFDKAIRRFHFDDSPLLSFCAMILYDEEKDCFRIPSVEVGGGVLESKYQA